MPFAKLFRTLCKPFGNGASVTTENSENKNIVK